MSEKPNLNKPEAPVKATAASRKFWEHHPVDIEREGNTIKLPKYPQPMALRDAMRALERKIEDENQTVESYENIQGFPLDAAVAFTKALAHMFGWSSPTPTPGFFGPEPPKQIGVQISPTETAQVFIGRFEVPNMEGYFETDIQRNGFAIRSVTSKRHAYLVKELAEATRQILKDESIYKGKALEFKTDDHGGINIHRPPKFLDTSSTNLDELVLNADVHEMVQTAVFTPVQHTDKCRKARIPLNRGVLLSGQYGVGKTMIARCAAKVCEENGWTFILLDKAQALKEGLVFAQQYAPAMVFCEDIDRVTSERDEKANDLLNTIDGIITKDAEVISVMTTNHVEKINPAMLRPGRLDSVITVHVPDAESVKRLVHTYAHGMIDPNEPLDEAAKKLAGNIPATIREAVERSKLRAIPKMNGAGLQITQEDLIAAAHEMAVHMALLEPKSEPQGYELLLKGLHQMVGDAGIMNGLVEQLDGIEEKVDYLVD